MTKLSLHHPISHTPRRTPRTAFSAPVASRVATLVSLFCLGAAKCAPAEAQASPAANTTTATNTATANSSAPFAAMTADAVQEAFVRVAARVKPSVVNILAERAQAAPPDSKDGKSARPDNKAAPRSAPPSDDDDENLSPYSPAPSDPRARRTSLGTGMVVRADGYVLTNYHVVRGASFIRVIFNSDSEQPDRPAATLVAFDEESDLAVLKIARNNLTPIEFADSDRVRIGEWAIAIGAPFEQSQTVTVGVVSAKGRHLPGRERMSFQDYIQTDASINPGNSGGPLIDLDGRVIGINTAILSPSRASVGIGFSVPSNTIQAFLPALLSGKSPSRGFLGINYGRVDALVAREFGVADGVQIGALAQDDGKPSGPALQAGLREGDVIWRVDGAPIHSSEEFRGIISSRAPGTKVVLSVARLGASQPENLEIGVTLGPWPLAKNARAANNNAQAKTGRLGLELADAREITAMERVLFELSDDARGVLIRDVASGSPADDAELQRGELLVRARVSGGAWQPIADKAAWARLEKTFAPGARVLVQGRTGGGLSIYKVVLVPG